MTSSEPASDNDRHGTTNQVSGTGLKTVYVGKNQRPILIRDIVPLSEKSWKRGYAFDCLNRTRGMVQYIGPFFYRIRSSLCRYANISNQLAYSGSLES